MSPADRSRAIAALERTAEDLSSKAEAHRAFSRAYTDFHDEQADYFDHQLDLCLEHLQELQDA